MYGRAAVYNVQLYISVRNNDALVSNTFSNNDALVSNPVSNNDAIVRNNNLEKW